MCCLAVAGHLPSFAMIPFRSDRPKVAQSLEDSFCEEGLLRPFSTQKQCKFNGALSMRR